MNTLFKNPEHQELLNKQGFVVLPFLADAEVHALLSLYTQMHANQEPHGFYSGSYSSDYAYKETCSAAILQVFNPHFEAIFNPHRAFGAAFLCKLPGADSTLSAHQDWSIADEERYTTVNCWVPLCDITPENGGLMVLPGSHYAHYPVLRAPTLPFFFSGHDDLVVEEMEYIPVKAGMVVIFHQSLVHYSPPNQTQMPRVAITAGVITGTEPLRYYYQVPESKTLAMYEQADDFLLRFDNFATDIREKPKRGHLKMEFEYQVPQISNRTVLWNKLAEFKAKAGYAMRTTVPVEKAELISEKKSWWKKWWK